MYADYLAECGTLSILETGDGFATYRISGRECYIIDIYVKPEKRESGLAFKMADQIWAVGKANGCTFLSGSVNTASKDPTASIKVLLAYGFKFIRSEPQILWFVKE